MCAAEAMPAGPRLRRMPVPQWLGEGLGMEGGGSDVVSSEEGGGLLFLDEHGDCRQERCPNLVHSAIFAVGHRRWLLALRVEKVV